MKKTVRVPPIQIRLSHDLTSLTVWTTEGKPSLDAEQVRVLILGLATARRKMAPRPPAEPPPDLIVWDDEPTTFLSHDPKGDGGILLIRDLGREWLAYRLSAKTLSALAARVDEILGRGSASARH